MLRSTSLRRGLVGSGLLISACIAACSGSKGGSGFGSSGSSGDDGDGGLLGSSGGPGLGGEGGGPVIGLDAACASQSSKGQLQPLDMYIMLDQSGSMKDNNKWGNVTSALNAFVAQPSMAGVGVGLQYFGVTGGSAGGCQNGKACASDADCSGGACAPILNICICSGGGDSCNAADYAKPEIEIEPLPGVAQKITASISAHSPSTGTPTSAALQGAVDHAKAWAQAHAGHVTIALLATDGDPEECDTNLGNIDAIAAAALAGNPKILTFVIGVGSSLSNLNGIAQAGGTNQAFIVDTGGNAQQQFLDALNKIRGQALGCVYSIPLPTGGGQIDFGTVNVQYTPGDGSPPSILPKVADKGSCPASGDAWYYDNNSAPTQIILCDSSCSKIEADKSGEVNIVFGCGTVVK
jgi:hypothetical protein